MDDSRRQLIIAELAGAIAAVARGDDEGAFATIRTLARGIDTQTTLPGMEPTAVKLNADAARRDVAAQLVTYWRKECGHEQAKPTPERITAVMARLRDGYTAAEIRKAIDGAKHEAFVSPDNGTRYDDIALICRNGSKLESFIRRGEKHTGAIVADAPASAGGPEERIAALRRQMAVMSKEGRRTEYAEAGRELLRLMAKRDTQPTTLRGDQ